MLTVESSRLDSASRKCVGCAGRQRPMLEMKGSSSGCSELANASQLGSGCAGVYKATLENRGKP